MSSADTSGTGPRWDPRYRRLEAGETIVATDECQRDDGSWVPAVCVGGKAPDPNYTSHRVYRRLADGAPVTVEQCDRAAAADAYFNWVAYSTEATRDEILAGVRDEGVTVQAFARHRLAAPASAPAGDGVDMAKYANMSIDEKANAMADDCAGDGWELVGYFREKARQAQDTADRARDAAIAAALARPSAAVDGGA